MSGKPIWPIEERPVPQGTHVPGEKLSPTQPFPTKPEPFARQSFGVDDLNPHILTPEEREKFKARIAKARNEGPFTPIGFEDVIHMPGNQGGSNWGSTAGEPANGKVYVIGFNVPTIIRLLKPGETRAPRGNAPAEVVKEGYPVTDGFGLYPTIIKPPYTTLTAYDLNSGKIAWQKGLGDDLRLLPLGITGTGSAVTVKGGMVVTGSNLLFATAADRKVHVYNSETGAELTTLPLGGPTSGQPAMYEHGGRQFLLVTASATQPTGPGAIDDAAHRTDRHHRLRVAVGGGASEEPAVALLRCAVRGEKIVARRFQHDGATWEVVSGRPGHDGLQRAPRRGDVQECGDRGEIPGRVVMSGEGRSDRRRARVGAGRRASDTSHD